MRWLRVTAGLGVALGCTSSSVFICEGDAQCGDGRCEANGYCSFPDASCDAGWAYGELSAPGLVGVCVGEETALDTDPSAGTTDEGSTGPAPTGDSGDSTGGTTGTAQATSYSDTNYGYDTDYVQPPYYCQAYASLIAYCYGDDEGYYELMWCTAAYESYYAQGYYCGDAFVDLLVCLSSLDCRQFSSSNQYCELEFDDFFNECNT